MCIDWYTYSHKSIVPDEASPVSDLSGTPTEKWTPFITMHLQRRSQGGRGLGERRGGGAPLRQAPKSKNR